MTKQTWIKNLIILIFLTGIGSYMPACKAKKLPKSKITLDNSGFKNYWSTELTHQNTELTISNRKNYIDFHWTVSEHTLVLADHPNPEQAAVNSDRVEIFLATDRMLSRYYTLEIDLDGRVFDAKCAHYRNIDFDWDWPDQLEIKTFRNKTTHQVHFSLSRKTLIDLELLNQGQLIIGIFRADYDLDGNSNWISWLNPKTEQPDFHTPKAFKKIRLP